MLFNAKDPRHLAALHLAAGCLPDAEVPPGSYDLAGSEIRIRFGDKAAVNRDAGEKGDGLEQYTATIRGLSLAAVLLILERTGAVKRANKAIWKQAIRDAADAAEKIPPEAEAAIAELKAELKNDPSAKEWRKTKAYRAGAKTAVVDVVFPEVLTACESVA